MVMHTNDRESSRLATKAERISFVERQLDAKYMHGTDQYWIYLREGRHIVIEAAWAEMHTVEVKSWLREVLSSK